MERFRGELPALIAGAVTGAGILGVVGRLATAALALALGRNANLSVRGLAEVLLVGAVVGAAGGFLLPPARRRMPSRRIARGVAVGLILFVVIAALGWMRGSVAIGFRPVTLLTLAVVAVVFVLYGILADRLWLRLHPAPPGEER